MKCAVYSEQSAVCNVQCTVYSVQCAMCSAQFSVCSAALTVRPQVSLTSLEAGDTAAAIGENVPTLPQAITLQTVSMLTIPPILQQQQQGARGRRRGQEQGGGGRRREQAAKLLFPVNSGTGGPGGERPVARPDSAGRGRGKCP